MAHQNLILAGGVKFREYCDIHARIIAVEDTCNNHLNAIQQLKTQLVMLQEEYGLAKKLRNRLTVEQEKARAVMESNGRILVEQAGDVNTVQYLRDVENYNPEIYCRTDALIDALAHLGIASQIYVQGNLILAGGVNFREYQDIHARSIAAENAVNNHLNEMQQLKTHIVMVQEEYGLSKKLRTRLAVEERKARSGMQTNGRILVEQDGDINTVQYLRDVKNYNPEIYCRTHAHMIALGNLGIASQMYPIAQAEEGGNQ